jgi:alpha-beta hydrolase superfamily lysophospholipase
MRTPALITPGLLSDRRPKAVLATALLLLVVACAPVLRAPGPAVHTPQLTSDGFRTADGEVLAVKTWGPDKGAAKTIIIALHGFNDYSNFFAAPAGFLADHAIRSYAYDQRGFGASAHAGLWSGTSAMVDDLETFTGLIRQRHPGTPLYLLGESMGGAVIMVAAARTPGLNVDGVILSAPAVWGRVTMPWYQRLALWIGVRVMPGVAMTGEGLKIKPSDNIEMLRALGRDPLVIKATRVDAIYGLVNLMDAALEQAALFDEPALILYGEKDEIIPLKPTRILLGRLPEATGAKRRVALYKDGYHMLLRDLAAEIPWRDIAGWIENPGRPLVSGADRDAKARLSRLGGQAP